MSLSRFIYSAVENSRKLSSLRDSSCSKFPENCTARAFPHDNSRGDSVLYRGKDLCSSLGDTSDGPVFRQRLAATRNGGTNFRICSLRSSLLSTQSILCDGSLNDWKSFKLLSEGMLRGEGLTFSSEKFSLENFPPSSSSFTTQLRLRKSQPSTLAATSTALSRRTRRTYAGTRRNALPFLNPFFFSLARLGLLLVGKEGRKRSESGSC